MEDKDRQDMLYEIWNRNIIKEQSKRQKKIPKEEELIVFGNLNTQIGKEEHINQWTTSM